MGGRFICEQSAVRAGGCKKLEMTQPSEALATHEDLSQRQKNSQTKLDEVRRAFRDVAADLPSRFGSSLAIFCAGSLARGELGSKSDLDLFFVAKESTESFPPLVRYTLFGKVIEKNGELGFPQFSNGGRFLNLQYADQLIEKTGTPIDDGENLFTARMLLLLESKWIFGKESYEGYLRAVADNYFRDSRGKRDFRPLFLLNDLLRYWRTLCLNYEQRRTDPEQPWRKKNVNLRFSRMVTVFSTVLAIINGQLSTASDVLTLCVLSPLERLARGIERLGDEGLNSDFTRILDAYEDFLTWKEDENIERFLRQPGEKERMRAAAANLADFLYRAVNHQSIPRDYRRYLII